MPFLSPDQQCRSTRILKPPVVGLYEWASERVPSLSLGFNG